MLLLPSRKMRGRHKAPSPTRSGAAIVELAVCLPFLALMIFASLEGANMLFVRQALVQSAYETSKASARVRTTQAQAEVIGRQVLAARRIDNPTFTFTPADVDALAPGTSFTVSVSAPGDSRSITGIGPFNGLTIQAQATMNKE